ncbi:hypothetical protein N9J02_01160 [bacterium]|jgi:hypothetical protein|nr:hypothetical protein [bacterium]
MANPIGKVAMLTRSYASEYLKKFDTMMKAGSFDNIASKVF